MLPADTNPQDVIKITRILVPIDVIVTDAKGRLVRNLKKEDFETVRRRRRAVHSERGKKLKAHRGPSRLCLPSTCPAA